MVHGSVPSGRRVSNLLWALLLLAAAVATPLVVSRMYAEVARIHRGGEDGVLEVIDQTRTVRGRRGRVIHHYDSLLDGRPVTLERSRGLEVGATYEVVYLPEVLEKHAGGDEGAFRAFRFGSKAESPWRLLHRELGTPMMAAIAGLELIWLVGAWANLRDYNKAGGDGPPS